jgi:hypothetical protein
MQYDPVATDHFKDLGEPDQVRIIFKTTAGEAQLGGLALAAQMIANSADPTKNVIVGQALPATAEQLLAKDREAIHAAIKSALEPLALRLLQNAAARDELARQARQQHGL